MKARLAAGVLALVAAFGGIPAQAGASGGICLMNLRFDFSGEISNNSPPRTYTMTGSGTCQTSTGIGKTGVMGGQGTASPSHCLPLLSMFGTYAFNIFPAPAPPDSNGLFNFVGTASAGLGRWDGNGQPTFVGLAPMVGGGVLPCLNGTNSLTFTTILVFVDP